ncbi:MAG: hypothetical protein KAX18_06460 [Candidatus Lokiarchaeota archaeon]|nr:hypothetical protein [Candidatus Lokiarchaeota archaeon]
MVGFNFLLLAISLFKSIEELHYIVIIVVFIISIPTVFIFREFLILFSLICLIANQLLTAFFAFKVCMDSSTKVDDFLYRNERYNKFTRSFEFIIFGLLTVLVFLFTLNVLSRVPIAARNSANIFRIIFWVNVILIIIVITRLVVIKKFAAYITLFFVLTFFYILYIIIDIIAEFIFPDRGFSWVSFLIDFLLFIFIIGSIYDKIEYLEKKLKFIRAETISLFVILMKLIAQFTKILPRLEIPLIEGQQFYILIIFIIFTLFFGTHSILVHKEGKKDIEIIEND